MMPEKHWCKEHRQEWVKKIKQGESPWYAHPILNDEGDPTGEWCNEPKEKQSAKSKPDGMSKEDWAEKDGIKQASIEQQTAVDKASILVVLKKEHPDDGLALAAYNWAMSKLGNWASSEPIPPTPKEPPNEPKVAKPTKEQGLRLTEALKAYSEEEAKDILIERWQTNTAKSLNREQMEDFITQLEKGKLEPEDIPF